jgi:endoplasmic reticulum Man9GlcNAc2 1,2-alpha-mannosidase
MYFLWKTTLNPLWRDRGWELCDALERFPRTPIAYSSIRRVDLTPVKWTDAMPRYVFMSVKSYIFGTKRASLSWFLAETLKYCFLLTLDDDPLPLERYVFNTEAHPLPRFGWAGWKSRFNVHD